MHHTKKWNRPESRRRRNGMPRRPWREPHTIQASARAARCANSVNGALMSTSLISTHSPFASSAPRRTAAPLPAFTSTRITRQPGDSTFNGGTEPSSTKIVSTSEKPHVSAVRASSGTAEAAFRARSGALNTGMTSERVRMGVTAQRVWWSHPTGDGTQREASHRDVRGRATRIRSSPPARARASSPEASVHRRG